MCDAANTPPPHINNELIVMCDSNGETIIIKYEHEEVAGTETYTNAATGAAVTLTDYVVCPDVKYWTECYTDGTNQFTKLICLLGDGTIDASWYDVQTETILAVAPASVYKCDKPDQSIQTDKDYCGSLTLDKAALLSDVIADGVLLPDGSTPSDIYQIDIDPIGIGRTIEHESTTTLDARGSLEFPKGTSRLIDLEGGDSSSKTGYKDKEGNLYPIADFNLTIEAGSCFRIALTLI